MAVAVNDVVRVTVQGQITNGSAFINAYHFQMNSQSGSPPTDAQVMAALEGLLLTSWNVIKADIASSVRVNLLDFYNVTQDVPVGTIAASSTWNTGLASGDPTPAQLAYLVSFKVGQKKTTGKKFLPGIPETTTTGGIIVPATVTRLLNFGAYLLGALNTTYVGGSATWYAGLMKNQSPTVQTFYRFLSVVASTLASTQRRRKQAVGS